MKKSFLDELKTALQIALLKHKDMHSVAVDKSKTKYAFYIIILTAVIGLIGQQFFMGVFKPTFGMGLGMAIYQVIMVIIGIYILSVIAKSIFKGQAKHDEFFRVMAYSMIVGFLTIIPMLGIITAIWGLILIFVILKTIHKLTTGGAIGTIIVAVIVLGILSMIIAPITGKLGFGYHNKGSYNFTGLGGERGTVDIIDKDNFEMKVDTPDGEGSFEMDEGKVKIEGPDGQIIEFNMQDYQ